MQADTQGATPVATHAKAQPRPQPQPQPQGENYRVSNAAERVALLIELRDSAAPVLMHAPDGTSLRTKLWVVDATAARLAFAVATPDLAAPNLEALLQSDEVSAVAHPGDVKLQFDLHGLVLVRGSTGAVLQAALPDELLRFQRRESFRVSPPVSAPVAYLRHPAIPDMSLALRVLDLSLGGCALRLPDDVPTLVPGTRIAGVTIELDLNTRLRVDLTLQHLTCLGAVDAASAAGGARIGCEWQLLRPEDERALQRWIDHTQVRKRLVRRSAQAPVQAGREHAADVDRP